MGAGQSHAEGRSALGQGDSAEVRAPRALGPPGQTGWARGTSQSCHRGVGLPGRGTLAPTFTACGGWSMGSLWAGSPSGPTLTPSYRTPTHIGRAVRGHRHPRTSHHDAGRHPGRFRPRCRPGPSGLRGDQGWLSQAHLTQLRQVGQDPRQAMPLPDQRSIERHRDRRHLERPRASR